MMPRWISDVPAIVAPTIALEGLRQACAHLIQQRDVLCYIQGVDDAIEREVQSHKVRWPPWNRLGVQIADVERHVQGVGRLVVVVVRRPPVVGFVVEGRRVRTAIVGISPDEGFDRVEERVTVCVAKRRQPGRERTRAAVAGIAIAVTVAVSLGRVGRRRTVVVIAGLGRAEAGPLTDAITIEVVKRIVRAATIIVN